MPPAQHLIGGRWTAGEPAPTITVLDPADDSVVGTVPIATAAEVAAAVEAAAAAQPRGASGQGFGYGPELLDELTTTKVVHLAMPPSDAPPPPARASSRSVTVDDADRAEVLAAVQRRGEALAAADASALRELLHPEFLWTSHRGDVLDRSTYIENNTAGALVWRWQSLTDPLVTVVEDTAVVVSVVIDEVERDGHPETYRMPMTQTWVRQHGRWTCLAGHAGPVQ